MIESIEGRRGLRAASAYVAESACSAVRRWCTTRDPDWCARSSSAAPTGSGRRAVMAARACAASRSAAVSPGRSQAAPAGITLRELVDELRRHAARPRTPCLSAGGARRHPAGAAGRCAAGFRHPAAARLLHRSAAVIVRRSTTGRRRRTPTSCASSSTNPAASARPAVPAPPRPVRCWPQPVWDARLLADLAGHARRVDLRPRQAHRMSSTAGWRTSPRGGAMNASAARTRPGAAGGRAPGSSSRSTAAPCRRAPARRSSRSRGARASRSRTCAGHRGSTRPAIARACFVEVKGETRRGGRCCRRATRMER